MLGFCHYCFVGRRSSLPSSKRTDRSPDRCCDDGVHHPARGLEASSRALRRQRGSGEGAGCGREDAGGHYDRPSCWTVSFRRTGKMRGGEPESVVSVGAGRSLYMVVEAVWKLHAQLGALTLAASLGRRTSQWGSGGLDEQSLLAHVS